MDRGNLCRLIKKLKLPTYSLRSALPHRQMVKALSRGIARRPPEAFLGAARPDFEVI